MVIALDPKLLLGLFSPAQAAGIQHSLAQTANQPVKKKKKKVASSAIEGSHLQTGTMASKPVTTQLEPWP